MEEENQKVPQKKRRVSLFKRRKKAEIRPFVRAQKSREYKKIVAAFLLFIVFIIILSASLFLFRTYVLEEFFVNNSAIVTPQGNMVSDSATTKAVIEERGLSVTNYTFATESAEITFILDRKTKVVMTGVKDVATQLDLVEAIMRQVRMDGKQAISLDLRYNKPIVKF